MAQYHKVSGTWKTVSADVTSSYITYVKIGTAWKPVVQAYAKIGGAWKTYYTYVIYTVPSVVGTLISAAQTAITNSGNVVGTITPINNAGGATSGNNNQVISQSVTAGNYTSAQTVNLSYYQWTQYYTVPSVVGQALSTARANITAAGAVNGTNTATGNAGGATFANNGTVATQSPAAGTTYLTQQTVALTYYSFTPYFLPNVVGQALATGQINIQNAGFSVGTVSALNNASGATANNNGTIASQGTASGSYNSVFPVTLSYYNYVQPQLVYMTGFSGTGSGLAGSTASINGTGFDLQPPTNISFNSTNIDLTGAFATSNAYYFTVPNRTPGSYSIQVYNGISPLPYYNGVAGATLTYTITNPVVYAGAPTPGGAFDSGGNPYVYWNAGSNADYYGLWYQVNDSVLHNSSNLNDFSDIYNTYKILTFTGAPGNTYSFWVRGYNSTTPTVPSPFNYIGSVAYASTPVASNPNISASNAYSSPGGTSTWTLTITNSGGAASSYNWGIQFSNSSGGTVLASATGSGGSIAAGGSVTVTRNSGTYSWARWVSITTSPASDSGTQSTGWA
jgi:beta-lactam-binding protein with PASTA domain